MEKVRKKLSIPFLFKRHSDDSVDSTSKKKFSIFNWELNIERINRLIFVCSLFFFGLCLLSFHSQQFHIDRLITYSPIREYLLSEGVDVNRLVRRLTSENIFSLSIEFLYTFGVCFLSLYFCRWIKRVCRHLDSLSGSKAKKGSEQSHAIEEFTVIQNSISAIKDKISKAHKLEGLTSELKEKTLSDDMTKLLNRRAFTETSEEIGITCRGVALAMIDIDDFKLFNDTFGHQFGDRLIKLVADTLRENVSKRDIIFRMGGDEYVILFEQMSGLNLHQVKRRITEAMSRATLVHEATGTEVTPHLSIGFSSVDGGRTLDELLAEADQSLYVDKNLNHSRRRLRTMENQILTSITNTGSDQITVRNTIVIADDDLMCCDQVKEAFSSVYNIVVFNDGASALEYIKNNSGIISGVLLDQIMPKMQGLDVLRSLRNLGLTKSFPVFMITGDRDASLIQQCYDLGAVDFFEKPLLIPVLKNRAETLIELYQSRKILTDSVRKQRNHIKNQADEIVKLSFGLTQTLTNLIEFRHDDSGKHVKRLQYLTEYLLKNTELGEGFSQKQIQEIALGAVLHDIGKIRVPDSILLKNGPLTLDEAKQMEKHPIYGAEIFESIPNIHSLSFYHFARDIILYHHERWEGDGYPYGLKGEQIPMWAHIVALVDAYDALITPRVYKKAFPHEIATQYILEGKCGTFDPRLLAIFAREEPQLRKIVEDLNAENSPIRSNFS